MRLHLRGVLVVSLLFAGAIRAEADFDPEKVDGALTWIEWWETNRDASICKVLKTAQPRNREPAAAKASAALLEATRSASADLRAEATMALARIGQGAARLVELTRDADQRVRCRAWAGLGLLQKEDELIGRDDLNDVESLAVVTGLGLLDKPGDPALARLRKEARSAKATEVRRMSVWALRSYHDRNAVDDKDDKTLILDLLRETTNPSLAVEAITALGTIGGRDNLSALADVADLGQQSRALPAVRTAMARQDPRMNTGGTDINRMRAAACLAIAQMSDGSPHPDSHGLDVPGRPATEPLDPTARVRIQNMLSRNAFKWRGEITAHVANNYFGVSTKFYPGVSVLALGRLGDLSTANDILNLRWPDFTTSGATDPKTRAHEQWLRRTQYANLPQRSYAAIAIGLAGNPGDPSQPDGATPPEFATLRHFASIPSEPRHLRAACILALGLSGRQGAATRSCKSRGTRTRTRTR